MNELLPVALGDGVWVLLTEGGRAAEWGWTQAAEADVEEWVEWGVVKTDVVKSLNQHSERLTLYTMLFG